MDDSRDFKIHRRGRLGEGYVCDYLKAHGCKIAATNYHSRFGEIDIIAENEVRVIFVEVKTRTRNSLAGGFESITPSKIKKITKTAAQYMLEHPCDKQIRIDCASVIVEPDTNKLVSISYIKNAVEQTGGYAPF